MGLQVRLETEAGLNPRLYWHQETVGPAVNARLVTVVAAAAIVAGPGAAAGQSAECATAPCAAAAAGPSLAEIWGYAGAAHEQKLAFVDALRDFTRAQTGSLGDEAAALRASLDAMREALGRWDRALGALETSVAGVRRTAEVHVALATAYLDRHRPDDALRELADARRLAPRRPDVHALRAHALTLLDRRAEAAQAFADAAALDPRPTILYLRAHQLRLADVRADLQVGPDADPQSGSALRVFIDAVAASPGEVLAAREPFERVALLRQPAGIAPVFAIALYAEGYAALERGDYRNALSQFARAVDRDPLTRAASPVRQAAAAAGAALRGGDPLAAIDALRPIAEQMPKESEVHRLLGIACDLAEDYVTSIAHFEAAVRLWPGDERAHLGLASALAAAGRTADAEELLRRAASQFPHSGSVRYALGRLYESQARYTEAVEALEASRMPGPIVGRDHLRQTLGRLYVTQAAFDHAVAAYVDRIDVNPNHPEAHRQLAEVYFLQGRDLDALAEFVATAYLDPADARAYAGIGQVYARMGDHVRAVAAFTRAVRDGAVDGRTRYLFGQSLIRTGRTEEGQEQIALSQQLQARELDAGRDEFQRRGERRAAEDALEAGRHADAVAGFERLIAAGAIELTEDLHRRLANAYDALMQREAAAQHRARADQLRVSRRQQRIAELAGSP